jgi:hypothetical protein
VFSPDGRTIATGGHDNTIRLWERATGKERTLFHGHQGKVVSLDFSSNGWRLVSCSKDSTALVWSLGAIQPSSVPVRGLEERWEDLAAEDAGIAWRALWAFTSCPEQSVPFLRQRLRPAAMPDFVKLSQWIKDLDAQEYATREQAAAAIRDLGESADGALRKALKDKPTAELRQRALRLLDEALAGLAPAHLRLVRSVEALEYMGTTQAKGLLKDLAQGLPQVRLTREAKASLTRLAARQR